MPCPQCQHHNPPAARFCNNCGAKLDLRCAACGTGNAPGSRFCSQCGEPLSTATSRVPPQSYTPAHLAARILTSRSAIEGERKQVTVLLADLKGSMELLADRDPEEARNLLDPVLERMMEAVHHYEGTVNQVMGDGIMALFGAPLAHEDHAVRACYAALRMQERIGRYGDEMQRRLGVPIQIRVGLNSGDVVVRSIGSDLHMDYTAVGQTTHLAARMEQMAKPGSILFTASTLRFVEGLVRVKRLGPVAIKGLSEPVEAFELLGPGTSRTRLQVSATRGLTRFVGRDAELDQLRSMLDLAGGGRGQVVALVGEPGVGKSRLVSELMQSHRTEGWLVLAASAVSYGRESALLPVIDLLKTYFGIDARDDARRVREKLTGRLLTLDEGLRPALPAFQALFEVPVDDPAWSALGAEEQRRQVLDAIRRLLLRESAVQPLLLVVEDLHWIDEGTRSLLDGLVERLPSHRIALLVNYRPEYRHDWGGRSCYGQIRLDPLPAGTAETFLEALVGTDPSLRALTPLLVARAQGNPFFLEESVRALVDAGVLAGERGAYRAVRALQVVEIPATVQAIIAARIDRLPPDDKSLLQAASVIGAAVPLPLLLAIADRSPDDVAGALARLQSAEFLYETRLFPDLEYTFTHALTHDVVYGSLLLERRRTMHARLVEAIEHLYADRLAEHRDRLVHHAFRGESWTKAVAYLRDMTTVASPEEIGEAMGKGPESPGRLWFMGEHERAARAAERDLAVGVSFGSFSQRIVASCRLGQACHALGQYTRAVELFRQTAGLLGGDLVHERFGMAAYVSVWVRTWLAWSLAELGEFPEAVSISDEAAAIAEAGDDAYSRAQAGFGRGKVYVLQGRPDLAVRVLEPALVVARVANIPFLVPFITAPLGAAYTLDGKPDRAVSMLEHTVEQADSMRLAANHAFRLGWLARARLLAGQRGAAVESARRAIHVADERRELGQQAHAQCLLGDVLERGDDADAAAAEAAYARAFQIATDLGMRPVIALCRLGLGRLHRRAGRPDAARDEIAAAAAMCREMGMTYWQGKADREMTDLA